MTRSSLTINKQDVNPAMMSLFGSGGYGHQFRRERMAVLGVVFVFGGMADVLRGEAVRTMDKP